MSTEAVNKRKLVNARRLLEIWEESSRPSMQWLRQHTGKEIPAVKVGRLYFYDPDQVWAALITN